jgi:hypothetical protein
MNSVHAWLLENEDEDEEEAKLAIYGPGGGPISGKVGSFRLRSGGHIRAAK